SAQHVELRALHSRGSGATRLALRGDGKRALRFFRRWREVGAVARQLAACAGLLDGGTGAFQRPRCWNVRPRLLDSRRPDADPADEARSAGRSCVSVSNATDLSIQTERDAGDDVRGSFRGTESVLRSGDQLLPQVSAGR